MFRTAEPPEPCAAPTASRSQGHSAEAEIHRTCGLDGRAPGSNWPLAVEYCYYPVDARVTYRADHLAEGFVNDCFYE